MDANEVPVFPLRTPPLEEGEEAAAAELLGFAGLKQRTPSVFV
jgi:hypothetical protein